MTLLLERHRWIDTHGQSWVDAGVVTSEQLDAIRDLERRHAPAPLPEGGGPTVPLAAELVLYLAAALVAAGSVFVVSRFWERLGTPGQLVIAIVLAVGGYVGAAALERVGATLQRPAAVLRLAGTAGVGLTTAVLALWLGAHDGAVALTIGPAVMAVGGLDWRNQERPLAFATTLAGVIIGAAGLATMLDPDPTVPGALVWLTSAVLLTLALRDVVHPSSLAALVASIGTFIGAAAFTADTGRLGVLVVLVNAGFLVAIGVTAHSDVVLAVGLVGFTITIPQAMGAYLRGLGAALGMLVAGLLILAVLIPRLVRRSTPPASEDRTGRPRSCL